MIIKKPDKKIRKNAAFLLALLCVGMVLLNIVSLINVIFVNGEEYREQAESQQMSDTVVTAPRGNIYDCNMNVLAQSASAWLCCATPNNIKKDETRENIAKFLSDLFSIDYDTVMKKLSNTNSRYEIIKKQVSAAQKDKAEKYLDENKYNGIVYFTPSSMRYYQSNNFASTVVGFINADGEGKGGLEYVYDKQLTGTPGRIITAKDARSQSMSSDYETVIDAKSGDGLVTTIDKTIQYYLEKALNEALNDYKAEGAYGIVMDVNTGAVKAMSNKPDFDPNNAYTIYDKKIRKEVNKLKGTDKYAEAYTNALFSQWNNKTISYTYEPGSVFKVFTLSAALEEGVVNENTTYNCNGVYSIGGWNIHCARRTGHGHQTLTQGLMNSCNPFFITIGQKLGTDAYFKYFEAFGFTEKTGIDLPGEAEPVAGVTYHPKDSFTKVNLASTSFGQSIKVTPIQIITAISAVANGGKLMQPYVVAGTVDADGNILSTREPVVKRQVISESTSKKVCEMMEKVVSAGTGKNAYIPGYRVAGKTATSQKLKESQDSEKDIYSGSFVCFAPADDPQIAVLIIIDNPGTAVHSGSVVAAPAAKEVMQNTLEYLNVEPKYTEKELATVTSVAPKLVGSSVSAAKQLAARQGYSVKVVGSGENVVSQNPAENQTVPSGGVIVVYTDKDAETSMVEIPDFTNKTISQVNQLAVEAGVNISFSGPSLKSSSVVSFKQSIEPGTKVEAGSSITVYFQETEGVADAD
ncbi:MAG: penicillin-binding transpeptidase domain-containing protein [Oscillospiraceae bacterium]|nr:penicillin-binding transpeptidase domain-containing protein [Oscillospiraceae bacterium]